MSDKTREDMVAYEKKMHRERLLERAELQMEIAEQIYRKLFGNVQPKQQELFRE